MMRVIAPRQDCDEFSCQVLKSRVQTVQAPGVVACPIECLWWRDINHAIRTKLEMQSYSLGRE